MPYNKNYRNLSMQEAQSISGGYSKKQCLKDIGSWTGTGALLGATGGGLAAGLGAIPGAYLGAHFGAIAGSAVCIGGIIGQ